MGLRIAFIGQKGFPATWGGIEKHVEQLTLGLARRGHRVSVYSRPWYSSARQSDVAQVHIARVPSIPTKHLDAATHSILCSLDALVRRYDIIHYHAIGPALFSWLPRLLRKRIIVTIHSFDYKRGKWGALARQCLRAGEQIALHVADPVIVVARHLEKHYAAQGFPTLFIPNGVDVQGDPGADLLQDSLGVVPGRYVLFLGRLVPEKRPGMLIRAFRRLAPPGWKLVIAGGTSMTDSHVKAVTAEAGGDHRVVFPGYLTGRLLRQCLAHCGLFVLPSVLEGLPIALLEAMSYAVPCLASDIPPHAELIEDGRNGLLFRTHEPAHFEARLMDALSDSFLREQAPGLGRAARSIIEASYTWDHVIENTEKAYVAAMSPSSTPPTDFH
ncbi:MAG: glycosyltransferase family 4 protein [Acidobacteriota bacterium]